MNLVGAGGTSDDDVADRHPIPDVRGLLADAAAAGLDPHRDAYISFHLRFDDRAAWERGAKAATDQWDVSAYSRPEAHMLRLCTSTPLTEAAVERQRDAVIAFAVAHEAVWESVAVEDLAPVSTWKAIAAQRTPAHDTGDADEPQVAQHSTGGDVA